MHTFNGVQYVLLHAPDTVSGGKICGMCAFAREKCPKYHSAQGRLAYNVCGSRGYFVVAENDYDQDRYALLKLRGEV